MRARHPPHIPPTNRLCGRSLEPIGNPARSLSKRPSPRESRQPIPPRYVYQPNPPILLTMLPPGAASTYPPQICLPSRGGRKLIPPNSLDNAPALCASTKRRGIHIPHQSVDGPTVPGESDKWTGRGDECGGRMWRADPFFGAVSGHGGHCGRKWIWVRLLRALRTDALARSLRSSSDPEAPPERCRYLVYHIGGALGGQSLLHGRCSKNVRWRAQGAGGCDPPWWATGCDTMP